MQVLHHSRLGSTSGSVAQHLRELVDGPEGCALVTHAPVDDASLLNLCRLLGQPITNGAELSSHPLDAGVIYRVEVRNDGHGIEDDNGHVMYSTTANDFPCHTDGYCSDTPAELVMLACVRADPSGGDTILVHVDELLVQLDEATREWLRRPLYPSLRGPGPILFGDPQRPFIRFNQREIERAGLAGADALPTDAVAALASLRTAIEACADRRRFRLEPGNCLVFDNRRILHGRTAMPPNSGRLLKRVWLTFS